MLLDNVSWQVAEGERWVVMGPNGAGKTTLMQIAAARLHPTVGSVTILGEELGAVDISELRTSIGWASGALADSIPASESVKDAVQTGAWSVTGRWRESYDTADEQRAQALLADWGLGELAQRTFGTLSEGERKRTLVARSLMADPELLLLDEPAAGMDLGGRESLLGSLSRLAFDPGSPTTIMVTHHLEEIPLGFTHGLLLSQGRMVAAGPLPSVLTDALVSTAFAVAVTVRESEGRWSAVASHGLEPHRL
ncbi:MAG: ABC transporter ATP-binding protein [Actinomycetota bacterium]|nr:ABC transporter ATP-binding protein [Actinomycetota bacterium]